MHPFTSILVDVDSSASAQPALEQAVRLARGCGARLKLVDVPALPWQAHGHLRAELERDLVANRRSRLARLAGGISGVAVDYETLAGPVVPALVAEVAQRGHDLLLRAQARDLAAPRPQPDGAVNVQLFRRCPCPVWAVGPALTTPAPKIVAAVHASADDPREQEINARVIETALTMADGLAGSMALVEAWRPFGEIGILNHTTDEEFAAHIREAQQAAARNLRALKQSFGYQLTGVPLELHRGDPINVIPQYAVANGVEIVVVGTSARTGVARLLMGNTADRLLERLPCSIVAVKPERLAAAATLEASA